MSTESKESYNYNVSGESINISTEIEALEKEIKKEKKIKLIRAEIVQLREKLMEGGDVSDDSLIKIEKDIGALKGGLEQVDEPGLKTLGQEIINNKNKELSDQIVRLREELMKGGDVSDDSLIKIEKDIGALKGGAEKIDVPDVIKDLEQETNNLMKELGLMESSNALDDSEAKIEKVMNVFGGKVGTEQVDDSEIEALKKEMEKEEKIKLIKAEIAQLKGELK